MTNFLFKVKKTILGHFLAHFPIFGDKKVFPKNLTYNLIRFSSTIPKFTET